MKLVLNDWACRTVPAKDPKVDAELRKQAVNRAHAAKTAAAAFSNTGNFRKSIHAVKHEKGYSVDINDEAALSIIFGHNNSGAFAGQPGRVDGHPEIIAALLS